MKKTNYRWVICSMLFLATTINYLDRQVLSLTWEDFIRPEFHWTNTTYGTITAVFSLAYAIAMLFAGAIIDKLDTKKGYLLSIGIWSVGAVLHALCGSATEMIVGPVLAAAVDAAEITSRIILVSMTFFIIARCILAIGEAGNFPVAIKATAEYFPKKDRAFATSIFNAGSTIGAMAAPFMIPPIAHRYGWEMAFIIIGALGFIWMGAWTFIYKKPESNPFVNKEELDYINSDAKDDTTIANSVEKISLGKCFTYKETWAFIAGKLLTDGVWWFFLFWIPSYLKNTYGMSSSEPSFQIAIAALYLIVMISILGGYLPSIFIGKMGMSPRKGRMRAMLIFSFIPLVVLAAQPLSHISYWVPVILIGLACAAHQSFSANLFSTVGDSFPKGAIATVTGIGGMAGGIGSFAIQKTAGHLFDFAAETNLQFLGFSGIDSGYMIIFSFCAVAYLAAWCIMNALLKKD